jgi:hypothetical protein
MSDTTSPLASREDSLGKSSKDATEATMPVAPDSPSIKISNEIGGRKGPEPTRYGDWEKNGRCIDF